MSAHILTLFSLPTELRTDREQRVLRLIATIVLLGLADLLITLAYMRSTGMSEANPIVRALMHVTGSSMSLVAYKGLTMLAGLGLIYHLRQHLQAELAAWLVMVVFAGVCVMWARYNGETANLDMYAFGELARSQSNWVMLQ